MLRPEEIRENLIKMTKIFHYGSLSLTNEPVRTATRKAVGIAEEAGVIISFDPNLRKPLWKTEALAREQIENGVRHCQVLKISDDELVWFTGKEDFDQAAEYMQTQYHIPLLLISMGNREAVLIVVNSGQKFRHF